VTVKEVLSLRGGGGAHHGKLGAEARGAGGTSGAMGAGCTLATTKEAGGGVHTLINLLPADGKVVCC
jgi:hypothetical protein